MSEKLNLSNVDLESKQKLQTVYKLSSALAWLSSFSSIIIFILFLILLIDENEKFMTYDTDNFIFFISMIVIFFVIFLTITLYVYKNYRGIIKNTINLVDSMTALYGGQDAYRNSLNDSMTNILSKGDGNREVDRQISRVVGNSGAINALRGTLKNITTTEPEQDGPPPPPPPKQDGPPPPPPQ